MDATLVFNVTTWSLADNETESFIVFSTDQLKKLVDALVERRYPAGLGIEGMQRVLRSHQFNPPSVLGPSFCASCLGLREKTT